MMNQYVDTLTLINQEFQDLQMNPITSIGSTASMPDPNNPYEWICSMMGPSLIKMDYSI